MRANCLLAGGNREGAMAGRLSGGPRTKDMAVGCAINIKATGETARPILDLWSRAEKFEDTPSMAALGYPPHFTFAIYDEVEPDTPRRVLRDTFSDQSGLKVTFAELRVFEVSPLVLWAAPADTSELWRLHELVHANIDPALCREHYRPGAWVPHCTLATRIAGDRKAEARSLVSGPMEPFDVTFDMADVVTFPPVAVVEEIGLG